MPWLAGLAMLPALIAMVGDLWWPFELCAHFHGNWALGLTASTALLLALGCWRTAAASGVVALADLAFVLPLWVGECGCDGAHDLRVMTVNVHSKNGDHAKLLRLLDRERPDVLAVLEFTNAWRDALEPLHEQYPHRVFRPRIDNFGIALYSKVPCTRLEVVAIGSAGIPSIEAELESARGRLSLIATHPLPPRLRTPPTLRDDQLAAVATRIAERSGPGMVLGDLNTSSWTRSFRGLCEVGRLRDARRGFGVQPTWPGRLAALGIAIDHVLVSDEISVCDYRVGPHVGSDHRPVTVDLRLASN